MTVRFNEKNAPFIDLGNNIQIALEFDEYSDNKSVEKAQKELRETPEAVESSLLELRDLIRSNKDLHIPINDDAFLIRFLRPRKYYAKSAYESIIGYFKMKAKTDSLTNNMTACSIGVALEERVVQLFPKRDQHGRRIIYMEMGDSWDSSKIPFPEVVRAATALVELLTLEPRTQLNGFTLIVNLDKLSLAHLTQFKPKFLKTVSDYGRKYAPIRIKSLNLINNAKFVAELIKIIKPFLGDKWGQRIHFHSTNIEALREDVNPNCLPVKMGGSCEFPEYDGKVLLEFLEHYQYKFDELNSFGYAERKI